MRPLKDIVLIGPRGRARVNEWSGKSGRGDRHRLEDFLHPRLWRGSPCWVDLLEVLRSMACFRYLSVDLCCLLPDLLYTPSVLLAVNNDMVAFRVIAMSLRAKC